MADGSQSQGMGSSCKKLGHLDLLDLLCSVIGGSDPVLEMFYVQLLVIDTVTLPCVGHV